MNKSNIFGKFFEMNDLTINLILNFILIITGIAMLLIKKPNYFIGLRTIDTLSDERVWVKSNRFAGLLSIIFGIILSIINIISYLFKWEFLVKNLVYIFLVILILIAIISSIYASIYAKEILKENKEEMKQFVVSRGLIYLFIILSFISIITGLILPFVPPNSFIGIRITKTLSDPRIWKIVNTISGIGFTIIGIIFTTLFLNVLRKDERDRAKIFLKYTSIFLIFIILWTLISIVIAYFV